MASKKSKKMINDPAMCVDENLEGFALINTGIRKIEGHRIMVREDYQDLAKQGKVCILSGGGSGHEPQEAGFVGRGMLTCCVMGSIFAAPPSHELLLGIRLIAKHNPAGCLIIIANYTGDRLNFGVAMEKAKQEGIRVSCVTVGDDCAMVPGSKSAGRRGLTGFPLTYKLAGALSEEGKNLDEMVYILNGIIKNIGSIGLSLSSCTIPGSTATFSIKDDEMELGLGVHGEPGVKTLKLASAKETVKLMIEHITDINNTNRIILNTGDRVLCMINNLGGSTHLEINIVAKELINYLNEEMGVEVERACTGYFNTSQEMAGFIITILKLDDTSTRLVDVPTEAPCWPRPLRSSKNKKERHPIEIEDTQETKSDVTGSQYSTSEEVIVMHDIISNICNSLMENEELLNKLDTEGGDGDCGTTLSKGAHVILNTIGKKDNPGLPIQSPYLLLLKLANIAENYMGGSTGALYSIFLTSGAVYLKDVISRESWYNALNYGIETIKRYGGAEVGDRTMLDPLCGVCKVLEAQLHNKNIKSVLDTIYQTAEQVAQDTAGMEARAGRASYVSADRLKEPDPGAVGVSIWIKAITQTLLKYYT